MSAIRRELELYNSALAAKPQIIVASKTDAAITAVHFKRLQNYCKRRKLDFAGISAVSGKGVKELLELAAKRLKEHPVPRGEHPEAPAETQQDETHCAAGTTSDPGHKVRKTGTNNSRLRTQDAKLHK